MPSGRRTLIVVRRVLAFLAVLAAASGCSRKLSSAGGGAMDVFFYDVLAMDRGTAYYFAVVRNAHDPASYAYKNTPDPFLADKCVDAIIHLGATRYARLEGEVQVILLLSDVLIEDPVSLARDRAAASLTMLAARMPATDATVKTERGDRFLRQLKDELDPLHDLETGLRKRDDEPTRRRVAALVEEIGSYDFPNLQLTKDALRWFPARLYITRETDPALRDVFDRAMVRRSRAVVFASLRGAVLDPAANVRQSAVQGLKTLADRDGVDGVAERLDVETSPLVRGEMAEYFGAVGGASAATKLVAMLSDDDGGVRLRAHRALVRLAGSDLGRASEAWAGWLARGGGTVAPPMAGTPSPSVVPSPVRPRSPSIVPNPPPFVPPPPVAPPSLPPSPPPERVREPVPQAPTTSEPSPVPPPDSAPLPSPHRRAR